MIRFREDGAENTGLGAINVNTCVIHPQVQQDGISVSTGSTTGAGGTVSSNTFVSANLTTGSLLAESNFNSGSILKWDFGLNQGVGDSEVHGVGWVTGSIANTNSTSYIPLTTGGTFNTTNSQRMTISGSGELVYAGTKPIYVDVTSIISIGGIGGNNEQFDFAIYKNGNIIQGSEASIELDSSEEGPITLNMGTSLVADDKLTIYQKSPSNDNFDLLTFMLKVKE